MKTRIPKNLLSSIEARRYGPYNRALKSTYRYNNRLMRNLVASPDWLFKRVKKLKSSKGIAFDCPDKLYAENHRSCFALRGPKGEPALLYSIDPSKYQGRWRYETYLTIMRAGMTNPNPPKCDLRLLLTSTSFLEIREENTGKVMDVIDLNSPDSPDVKFNTMRHDLNLDQVIVTSTKTDEGIVLRYIVVLEICPVVRRALRIPIRKDVFGESMTEVDLFDGMLRTLHKKEIVKVYDFEAICRINRIIDGCHEKLLLIENLCEPLYVVNGSNLMLEIDGFPYHYIACSQSRNEYTVRTMEHRELASFPIHENDSVAFYQDNPGIIAHSDKDAVTLYKMKTDGDTGTESLKKLNVIKILSSNGGGEQRTPKLHDSAVPERRSQRRTIRRPSSFTEDEDEQSLFTDDFENELHLVLLMGNDLNDPHKRGVIQLFDSETGSHVKTMKFSKKLSENEEYLIALDLDVLVVVAADGGGTSGEAHVYRLLHREAWGDECPKELYDLPAGRTRQRLNVDIDFAP